MLSLYFFSTFFLQQSDTAKRGAVVKAMTFCTRYPWLHVLKVWGALPSTCSLALEHYMHDCIHAFAHTGTVTTKPQCLTQTHTHTHARAGSQMFKWIQRVLSITNTPRVRTWAHAHKKKPANTFCLFFFVCMTAAAYFRTWRILQKPHRGHIGQHLPRGMSHI